MKRRNIFITTLLVLCMILAGCTPKDEPVKPEQKEEPPVTAVSEAEEILTKMNTAMAEKDDYLLKTELLGRMETSDVRKEMQLFDECRILWMNDSMVLQGQGNLALTAAAIESDKKKFDNYTWQYYTEETEEGLKFFYTSDLSGKRQQETVDYPSFAELQKQVFLNEENVQNLVMTAEGNSQLKEGCRHIDLTLAPSAVPMLQVQLKQAGIVLSEGEWQNAPAVTMTLAISPEDYTLQRVSMDCTPIFEQWLINNQIAYIESGVTETPFMMMEIDVYYNREIH